MSRGALTRRIGRSAGLCAAVLGLLGAVAVTAATPAYAAYPGLEGPIAFVNSSQIFTVNPDGTGLVQLTRSGRNFAPRFSPDGTRIAFVHQGVSGRTSDLWVMNGDGSHKTRLTHGGGINVAGATWSPDATRLAVGGPCVSPPRFPSLCPTGVQYALDLVTMSSGVTRTLPGCFFSCSGGQQDGPFEVTGRVAWSADGKHLAFPSDDFPSSPDHYLLDYNTTNSAVTEQDAVGGSCCGEGFLENPAFGPKSVTYAFDGTIVPIDQPVGPPHITICQPYPINQSGVRCDLFPAVAHDQQPAYSPSAAHIVLMNDASGTPQLLITDWGGAHRHFLAPGSEPDWQPVLH
jgi:Tol biopolymer transport system component